MRTREPIQPAFPTTPSSCWELGILEPTFALTLQRPQPPGVAWTDPRPAAGLGLDAGHRDPPASAERGEVVVLRAAPSTVCFLNEATGLWERLTSPSFGLFRTFKELQASPHSFRLTGWLGVLFQEAPMLSRVLGSLRRVLG